MNSTQANTTRERNMYTQAKHASVTLLKPLRVDLARYSIKNFECEFKGLTSGILLLESECNVA